VTKFGRHTKFIRNANDKIKNIYRYNKTHSLKTMTVKDSTLTHTVEFSCLRNSKHIKYHEL